MIRSIVIEGKEQKIWWGKEKSLDRDALTEENFLTRNKVSRTKTIHEKTEYDGRYSKRQ